MIGGGVEPWETVGLIEMGVVDVVRERGLNPCLPARFRTSVS